MEGQFSQVFFPANFQELFNAWNRFPDAVLYAGGTEHIRNQSRRIPILPKNIISLANLDEIHKISRTERYIEFGAMVKLNQIINMGKIIPEALIKCIECIAGPEARNLATIGGNLCNPADRLDCSALMVALDAQFELRTARSSRWIAASRFSSLSGPPDLASQEILSRIRIPLEPWNFSCYHKFRTVGINQPGGGIVFLMRNQKNILTHLRVIYSGKTLLREKDGETMLAGKHLPLGKSDAAAFVEAWKKYISGLEDIEYSVYPGSDTKAATELAKARIISFIESTILNISD